MPCSVAAIFGAEAAIWSTRRSPPSGVAKFERQAVPVGASRPSWMQSTAAPTSPTSLPPMPTVTSPASADSASNCGVFVPPGTLWGSLMWRVVADEQLVSRKTEAPSAARTTEG